MEWFFGPKGLKFSEIGCRPPGVRAWDLYNVGNDMDLYREWAMVDRPRAARASAVAPLAAGIIALRPDRDGRIAGYEGLDAGPRGASATASSTGTCRPRARRRSRSRPATWRTRGSA